MLLSIVDKTIKAITDAKEKLMDSIEFLKICENNIIINETKKRERKRNPAYKIIAVINEKLYGVFSNICAE